MIWILRNIGVHLWLTTLFSIPFCFYILPGLTRFFPNIDPVITGLVTIVAFVVMAGCLMDITAKKIVAGLIKEGQAWERSGLFNRAEKKYVKALRVYDTFLLFPFSAKKTARILSGTIAKFKLNTDIGNQNFKLAAAVYLKMNPADKDIAGLWLKQVRKSVTSFEQDVLSLLAEMYSTDKLLSVLLIDIFLGLERKDFTAKKLYLQVIKEPVLEARYSKRVSSLIGESKETILEKVSYVLPHEKPHEKSVIKPAKKPGKKNQIGKNIQRIARKTVLCLKRCWGIIGSGLSFLILNAARALTYVREHEKAQFYLKAVILSSVSIWLGFFMISTMSHMFRSKAVEKEKIKIEIQLPRPFTIQVSAYLKQKHADRYVDVLKKKGIDASVKKVGGGGKTWFVVRVSKFVDKKSATAYGLKLKQEKIIDDFFVNNR